MSFSVWMVGIETITIFVWTSCCFPSNFFGWFFPWPQVISSQACTDQNSTLLGTGGEPSAALWGPLCTSPLQYSVLCTLATKISLYSWPPLLRFGGRQAWVPLPTLQPGNSLQTSSWGQSQDTLGLFPISHRSQYFASWCPLSWKPWFQIFCLFLWMILLLLFQAGR